MGESGQLLRHGHHLILIVTVEFFKAVNAGLIFLFAQLWIA